MDANVAQLQSCMYQYSRAIYRSIKDLIDPYVDQPTRLEYRRAVLCECEETMSRLAHDPQYFARPDRALFQDIRRYFPITAQAQVAWVVKEESPPRSGSSRRSWRPGCSTGASAAARRRRARARPASERPSPAATTALRTSTSSGRRSPPAQPHSALRRFATEGTMSGSKSTRYLSRAARHVPAD